MLSRRTAKVTASVFLGARSLQGRTAGQARIRKDNQVMRDLRVATPPPVLGDYLTRSSGLQTALKINVNVAIRSRMPLQCSIPNGVRVSRLLSDFVRLVILRPPSSMPMRITTKLERTMLTVQYVIVAVFIAAAAVFLLV